MTAGQIAKITGLAGVQIGDTVGAGRTPTAQRHFAPPTLETVVIPARASETGALHAALAQLAEQDPLINLRQDDIRHELTVSLYGEVQKEVIQATLADEFGLQVSFRGDHDDLRRATGRHGRCRGVHGRGRQSVPRHRGPTRGAGPGRVWHASSVSR